MVTKPDGQILRISGLDINWEEIQLTLEQAAENNWIVGQIVAGSLEAIIARQRERDYAALSSKFGNGELLWLAAASIE